MTRSTKTARRSRNVETPTIVLKTLHDDIVKSNPNSTLTTKSMRAKLRVVAASDPVVNHVRNSSWIFTQSQYDHVRSMFDASYSAKLARAAKRNTTSRKPRAKSNAAADAPTTTDA